MANQRLISVRDFSEKHKFLTQPAIRSLIRKNQPKIESCLIRISNRVYIDEDKFFDFLTKISDNVKNSMGLIQAQQQRESIK